MYHIQHQTAYLAAPFGVKAANVQHHPYCLQVFFVIGGTGLGRHEAYAVFALPLACEHSQDLFIVHHTASHSIKQPKHDNVKQNR